MDPITMLTSAVASTEPRSCPGSEPDRLPTHVAGRGLCLGLKVFRVQSLGGLRFGTSRSKP